MAQTATIKLHWRKCFSLVSVFMQVFFTCSAQQQSSVGQGLPLPKPPPRPIAIGTAHRAQFGFIIGELDHIPAVPALKLEIIKYLHDSNNINHIFMEIGTGAAYLYNRYLTTGDTGLIAAPALVYATTAEGREFWQNLYQYNSTTHSKIIIHGIDFERMEFMKVLRLLQPANKPVPPGIKSLINYIDTLIVPRVNAPDVAYKYSTVQHQIKLHHKELSRFYGAQFSTVTKVMNNPNTYAGYANRNKTMYTNTIQQLNRGNISKYVLFVGAKHCNSADKQSLSARLLRNKHLKTKTTCWLMQYREGILTCSPT